MTDSTERGIRDENVRRLVEAMWDLLCDMGADGLCVCPAAKAQARIAYEPFRAAYDPHDLAPPPMSLLAAIKVARAAGSTVNTVGDGDGR